CIGKSIIICIFFFFSSRRRHTRFSRDWSSDVCSSDLEVLFKLCEKGLIIKTRHLVKVNNHTFEVDEFFGDNEGLIIAEIELNHVTELFTKPTWLGKEVTGNIKYYNSQLSKQPYNTW